MSVSQNLRRKSTIHVETDLGTLVIMPSKRSSTPARRTRGYSLLSILAIGFSVLATAPATGATTPSLHSSNVTLRLTSPAMNTSGGVPSNYINMTADASPNNGNWAQYYGPNLRVFYRYFDVSSALSLKWHVTDTKSGAALRYYPVWLTLNKNDSGQQRSTFIAIVNGMSVQIPANTSGSDESRIAGTTNASGDVTFTLFNSNDPVDAEARPVKLTIPQPDYVDPLFSNITLTTAIPETSETKDFLWAHFLRPKNWVAPTPPTYLWSQEFNDAKGALPVSKYWNAETGDGCSGGNCGWGNGEKEYYIPGAAATDGNGSLVLSATKLKNSANRCYYGTCEWSSARYQTLNKVRFRYGLIEARIKAAPGTGSWPAIWFLGNNFASVGWPRCGEIDMGEWAGYSPNTIWGTGHWSDARGNRIMRGSTFANSGSLTSAFHTYGLSWQPDRLQWLIDGQVFFTLNKSDVAPNNWPFNSDMFLIINLAMGGSLAGNISPTLNSSSMTIDWIHYSKANGLGAVSFN